MALYVDDLVLQVLVVLAVLVGDGAHLFRRLRGQFAVGRGVGERDLLPGIDADLALEQDQVFFLGVLGVEQRLLLGLQLHARAQLVQIGGDTGLVRGVGVVEQNLSSATSALALSTSLEAAMACR